MYKIHLPPNRALSQDHIVSLRARDDEFLLRIEENENAPPEVRVLAFQVVMARRGIHFSCWKSACFGRILIRHAATMLIAAESE